MREIKCLVDEMKEELASAKEYAKTYTEYKASDPVKAKKYMEMAKDELKHAMYLHDIAVDKIDEATAEGIDAPDYMKEIWTDEHNCYLEQYAVVQYILGM